MRKKGKKLPKMLENFCWGGLVLALVVWGYLVLNFTLN